MEATQVKLVTDAEIAAVLRRKEVRDAIVYALVDRYTDPLNGPVDWAPPAREVRLLCARLDEEAA